jgi:hypothetical protein
MLRSRSAARRRQLNMELGMLLKWMLGAAIGLLASALVLPQSLAGTKDDLSRKEGFRDLTWGSVPVDGMSEINTRYNPQCGSGRPFVRDGDSTQFGRVPATKIVYCYSVDSKLFMVWVNGYADLRHNWNGDLVTAFTDAYGEPVSKGNYNRYSNISSEEFLWASHTVELKLWSNRQDRDHYPVDWWFTFTHLPQADLARAAARAKTAKPVPRDPGVDGIKDDL